MNDNLFVIAGIVFVATGIIVIVLTQLILRRWLKKFNQEWEDTETNGMS